MLRKEQEFDLGSSYVGRRSGNLEGDEGEAIRVGKEVGDEGEIVGI